MFDDEDFDFSADIDNLDSEIMKFFSELSRNSGGGKFRQRSAGRKILTVCDNCGYSFELSNFKKQYQVLCPLCGAEIEN